MSEIALAFYKHIKHNSKCMVCGSTEHLNFHHIKPVDKITEIFKLVSCGDLTATVTEMNKCIPLCEFDHRRVHQGKLHGWLDGHYDNGKQSVGHLAYQYAPYLNWLGRRKPQVIKSFYRENIERNHLALWPIFNATALKPPPRLLLRAVQNEAANDASNDIQFAIDK